MKQFCVTPSMGKRLIGKAMAKHLHVRKVLDKGTLVIMAGTTNGYVAEEVLSALGQGQADGFSRQGFRRGMTVAPGANAPGARGPRLYPALGEVFTEIDAIRLLTGSDACLIASGGIYGAEGAL